MSSTKYLQGLYGVTDTKLMPNDETLLAKATMALEGGMQILQYRDKTDDHPRRLRQAIALRELCEQNGALFLVNDDVDLTIASGAHGVHLGQSDEALPCARQRLGSQALIGISCGNSLELGRKAVAEGADYIAFGRFYISKTKPTSPQAPLYILEDAHEEFSVPIVAIGGVTRDNGAILVKAGADMLAVVNDLFSPEDVGEIRERARQYTSLFRKSV